MNVPDLQDELRAGWQSAIAANEIVNRFRATRDDPSGRWRQNDDLNFGLHQVEAKIGFFAENATTGQTIRADVLERVIDDGFVVQFNGYRALRPGGMPERLGRQPDISSDAVECRFYCQNPQEGLSLWRRRPVAHVALEHFRWNAYANATPFEKEGHVLWVPVLGHEDIEVISHLPQRLSLHLLTELVVLSRACPDTIVFFNSLHAGASVNHIHAQAVVKSETLPIERAKTGTYKGYTILEGYSAGGIVFEPEMDAERLFTCVDRLQRTEAPFNLIMVGGRIVLVPRNPDHEVVSEFPGGVLATMELCGKLITVEEDVYKTIDSRRIAQAFRKTTLPARTLIDKWARMDRFGQ